MVPPLIVALSCELCCLFGVRLDSILSSNRHQFHQMKMTQNLQAVDQDIYLLVIDIAIALDSINREMEIWFS